MKETRFLGENGFLKLHVVELAVRRENAKEEDWE
jgi:hypothetical protein